MEVVKIILQIAGFLGISSLFTLFITERIKNKIKSSFDIKLEEVKMINSKEISQFQSELNHLKSRENFKFTKLHEIRLEVLQKTFQYLNENLSLLEYYIAPVKFTPKGNDFDEDEKLASQQYREAHHKFWQYFKFNSIYFDEDIESSLISYFKESSEIFNLYDKRLVMKSMGQTLEGKDMLSSAFAYKKIPEIIHPLKKEIETKFRKLLGE